MTMRTTAQRLLLASACILPLSACSGRPLLYQLAPSETDQETIAAFQTIDTARKGQLTRQEVDDFFRRRFAELDRNRDGFLDAAEAQPATPLLSMKSGRDMVFRLDANLDGRLSLDEFLTLSNYLFVRDENNDGVLTLAEVRTPPVETYKTVGKTSPGLETVNPAARR